MHEFETENLVVRLLTQEDKECFVSLYTDPKTMKHIAAPLTYEAAEAMFNNVVKNIFRDNYEMMIWAITSKSSGSFLGVESLNFKQFVTGSAEAGLILNRLSHGKGTAVEALVGLINYGFNFLSLNTIYASCTKGNYAPQRVLRMSGFTKVERSSENSLTYCISCN